MTAVDCGCGCGGASATTTAFVRPRFFAGQLLTEDDLSLLVDYLTGKNKLHNRMLFGPGVVCGLDVGCDPCGAGTVVVGPGHALDCCGNDIVLSCKEKVDVAALVRELRVASSGVDCGDPCDDGSRSYGLYVRYEEDPIDPVTPYATEEPCPTPGCVPSRIREGFRFLVKCATGDDHRFNPGSRLLASIGDQTAYEPVRLLAQRLGMYLDPINIARTAQTRTIEFDGADAERYQKSLAQLQQSGDGTPAPPVARDMTENVRALAAAIARYDTYDQAGQQQLASNYNLSVDQARAVLGAACDRLAGVDLDQTWPGPFPHRSLAAAVVAEAKARAATPGANAPMEVRLLAQGTPISNVLQVEFRSDLARIREWLLGRIDRSPGVADCKLRADILAIAMPQLLPTPDLDSNQLLTITDLDQIAAAAAKLTTALRRFVTDAMCATLNPPCTDCADTDVLLAHLQLDGCDVVRVCGATREQVLPGGSEYGEWLPKLYPLRALAERLCCTPIPQYQPPSPPSEGPVPRPYVAGLLDDWPRTGDLEEMWSLLLTPAPGETPPKALHEQAYTVPSEVTDSLNELTVLRNQIGDLTAIVTALRGQLDTARDHVDEVREQLPDRLEARLAELENASTETQPEPAPAEPPSRRTRSTSTRRPRSGEGS